MPSVPAIDAVLRGASDACEVPGVVAVAATADRVVYEGAFGRRDLAQDDAMTLDTIFRIASMTKAVTSIAAMQLVEAGRLDLDEPIGRVLPELASPHVLTGFDAAGKPRLRPARRPITLRHLLTHTAGFGYEMLSSDLIRYIHRTGTPSTSTGKLASLHLPLLFDPGERWEYGINIEWVGQAVEAAGGEMLDVYCREHIFDPLGMSDTGFELSLEQSSRLARVHQRQADGSLAPITVDMPPQKPEFWAGGGGLYSTGRDYLTFLQMVLNQGRRGDTRLLRPETVAAMATNQTGDLDAGIMRTAMPDRTNDFALFAGMRCQWGLGWMITPQPGPNGRSAGSLTWGGIFNSYYWIDPLKRVAGVILTQFLPFADPHALALAGAFEREVYAALDAG
ncbi:MAG TPA: serine hydrolase domain-containing protein [Stellaceae bacterium]